MSQDLPPTPTPRSAVELCPSCRSEKVRRSSSPFRHVLRVILRSPKRYCPSCRKRWTVAGRS